MARLRSAAVVAAAVAATVRGAAAAGGVEDPLACLLLSQGSDVAQSAYWNASAQHGTLFYDGPTDGVYLWPHAVFSVVSATGVPCMGVLAPPWDPSAPAGSSRYLLRRSAAEVQARPYGGWTPGAAGSNATVAAMADPPPGSFYSNNVVWMPDRRQLFAFGGLTLRSNVSAADCPQQAWDLNPGPGQCAVLSNDTHVFDLATMRWRHYPAAAAGVPFAPPGPPSMQNPYQPLSFQAMVSMAYDTQRRGVWLVGGKFAVSFQLPCSATQYGLFFFALASGAWQQVATVGEGPCASVNGPMASLSTMFVNPARDELVVYSGVDGEMVAPSLGCAVLSLWSSPMSWRADGNCAPSTDGSRDAPTYLPATWMDPRDGGAAYVVGGLYPGACAWRDWCAGLGQGGAVHCGARQ
jgi:hypothetical protein